jgi:hypothetical protein
MPDAAQAAPGDDRHMTTRSAHAIHGLLVAALTAVAAAALAGPATAANQSTLDHAADSMGPIAVDQSGNGYVAWLHRSGAGDTDMFCKLPAGKTKCADPITLTVSLPTPASTNTPFPVLGPGADVYVVAPSYDSTQMVIWESTDGGLTFGPSYVGPSNAVLADPLDHIDTCDVGSDLDDVIGFNALGGQYDRSQGTGTLGSTTIDFEMSSGDPFLLWSFTFDGSPCAVPSSVTVTPGKIPAQWFTQGGDHSGVSDVSTDDTTLGWAGGGTVACSLNAPGDEVQAYQVGDDPLIRFFRWSTPTGPCGSDPGVNVSPSGAENWSGPMTVSDGQFPRLAGGKAGLFLLSGDDPGSSGAPTAVDIRPYELSSHNFGAAQRLATVHNPSGLGPDAGGLGESYTTGELAAVWPDTSGDDGLMSLFISTDGGTHFSGGQAIAHVAGGYAINDNARVAVAANGTGYVTWEDDGGLRVADLEPLASGYERLEVHHSSKLELPVTCEAPKGSCTAIATVGAKGFKIAHGRRKVPSGTTKTLVLILNAKGISLLSKADHHELKALLSLKITHSPSKTELLKLHTLIAK